MIDDTLNETDTNMKKAVEAFERDLQKVRTDRASTALLDDIRVEYYGTLTPINQLATVEVVEARLLTVKPWDKGLLSAVERAIRTSNLGINPLADSELIRLPLPPLTQERRRALAGTVSKQTEDARVAIRAVRRDGINALKKLKCSEDERKLGEKKVQDLTDRYIATVNAVAKDKEKAILEFGPLA